MNKLSISAVTIATLLSLSAGMALAAENPFGGTTTTTTTTTSTTTTEGTTATSTTGTSSTTTTTDTTSDSGSSESYTLEASYDTYELMPQNNYFVRLPVNQKIRSARYYKQLGAQDCGAEARRLADFPANGTVLAGIDDSQPIRVIELCPTAFIADANPEILSNGNVVGYRDVIAKNEALSHVLGRQGFDADNVVAVTRGREVVYVYVHNAG